MRNLFTEDGIWRRLTQFLCAATLGLMLPVTASAATINITGLFAGGQLGTVNFDIDFTADFTVDHFTETAGITVNSLKSTVFPGEDPFALTTGPISFTYHQATGFFIFGGGDANILLQSDTDFFIRADNPLTSISHTAALDSLASIPSTANGLNVFVTATQVAAVPLPAGLPLLMTGFFGIAGLRRFRKQRALSASRLLVT